MNGRLIRKSINIIKEEGIKAFFRKLVGYLIKYIRTLRKLIKHEILIAMGLRKLQWRLFAQKGELNFWRDLLKDQSRISELVEEFRASMKMFGYEENAFVGKTIIDVGSGPKLRSKYFFNAKIIAIEPLANEYMQIDGCDLDEAKTYSEPAEKLIPELENIADFAICINVLDHVFKPEMFLRNIFRYLRPESEFLLSVDLHDKFEEPLHPVNLSRQKLLNMFRTIGWEVLREYNGLPGGKKRYGQGRAITFVLKKKE